MLTTFTNNIKNNENFSFVKFGDSEQAKELLS